MKQKIIRIGSSAGIIIPKKSMEEIGFRVGDEVGMYVNSENKEIRLVPTTREHEEQTRIAKLVHDFMSQHKEDLEKLSGTKKSELEEIIEWSSKKAKSKK